MLGEGERARHSEPTRRRRGGGGRPHAAHFRHCLLLAPPPHMHAHGRPAPPTCAAIVAADEHVVRVPLDHARRHHAHAVLGHQLDGHARGGVAAACGRGGQVVGPSRSSAPPRRARPLSGSKLAGPRYGTKTRPMPPPALQVVDQLRQVLDGVDVVVRRRADEAHARRAVARARNVALHLAARQLPALACPGGGGMSPAAQPCLLTGLAPARDMSPGRA